MTGIRAFELAAPHYPKYLVQRGSGCKGRLLGSAVRKELLHATTSYGVGGGRCSPCLAVRRLSAGAGDLEGRAAVQPQHARSGQNEDRGRIHYQLLSVFRRDRNRRIRQGEAGPCRELERK